MIDKDRFEGFLRTLLGALSVASLLVALSGFGSLFGFTWRLVAAWVVATGAAHWLVYGDGWARLRAAGAFRPVTRTATATLLFVLLALALKMGLTAATIVLLEAAAVPQWAWLAESALAVALAYAALFLTGPDDG